jgi:small subunit ribosomal protein S7
MILTKEELKKIIVKDEGLKKYLLVESGFNLMYSKGNLRKYLNEIRLQTIVDRLVSKLMRLRRKGGKKIKTYLLLKDVFEKLRKLNFNPIDILVRAIEAAAPCEGYYRMKVRGMSLSKSAEYSPIRRINISIMNLAKGISKKIERKKGNRVDLITEEILITASGENESFAISKRKEIEKIAKISR